MRRTPFQQVDVFTSIPFQGNAVAVVFDGDQFSTEEAQGIARWTNLSETTFVCRPTRSEADYRLRIFTPRGELPFAGHPTIGSAHAILRHGLQPRPAGRLVQECGRGLVPLRIEEDRILLELPATVQREPTAEQLAAVAEALGVATGEIVRASIVDVGPVWLTLQLADVGVVLGLQPAMEKLSAIEPADVTGVTVFALYPKGSPADVEVRSFAPAHGVFEDPVCGSGNGCVAVVIRSNRVTALSSYLATQGRCVGRDGRVHVQYADDGAIWLGGAAVTCIEGTLTA